MKVRFLRAALLLVTAFACIESVAAAGIHAALFALPDGPKPSAPKTLLGFIGKAIESAEFMLAESCLDKTERGEELRRRANKIIASFLRIKMAPLEAEGFYIQNGKLRDVTRVSRFSV